MFGIIHPKNGFRSKPKRRSENILPARSTCCVVDFVRSRPYSGVWPTPSATAEFNSPTRKNIVGPVSESFWISLRFRRFSPPLSAAVKPAGFTLFDGRLVLYVYLFRFHIGRRRTDDFLKRTRCRPCFRGCAQKMPKTFLKMVIYRLKNIWNHCRISVRVVPRHHHKYFMCNHNIK